MDKSKEPILILIVIIIIVGLSWDSLKKGNFSGTSTSTPQKEYSDNYDPYYDTQIQANNLQTKLESKPEDKTKSKYYGKISISYVSSLNSSDPSSEYITIYPNLNQNEKVKITGWMLKSERSGNWVKIGKASYLPYPNTANYEDIVLKQGDMAYLIKGFSPIGISFRSNKCTGYFGQNRNFYPYLNRSCPLPKNEKLPKFSDVLDREDECLDIIERLPYCTDPSYYMNFNKFPDTVTQSCKDYLENEINYDTCVENHILDTDFAGREWYIYMNVFGPLWRDKREKIILYDSEGLIVSSISYSY